MIGRLALIGLQGATLGVRGALAARTAIARRHGPPAADGPLSVLMLSQYPAQFAGTKYRLSNWAARLRGAGHAVDVVPVIPSPHAERLLGDWSVGARVSFHLRMLFARLGAVLGASRYDVAIVHMNDLPFWEYGEPFVARALGRLAGRVLLDLDDLPVFRGESELRPRTRQLAAAVDGLIVGNPQLRAQFPDIPAWIVPTVIEAEAAPTADRSDRTGPVVLGWVGSIGNARHLERIAPALSRVCAAHDAHVRVIGGSEPDLAGVPHDFVRWSAEREFEDLLPIDVGLAPLSDGLRERCKCGLKALQYMSTGAPAVVSPVGALADIVEDGVTGLHATTDEEWESALTRLVTDRDLRLRAGAAARSAVESRWSNAAHVGRYLDALRGVRPE